MKQLFRRILLATDGSKHSGRSTTYAKELAEKFDGSIDIVYVVDGETSKEDVLHHTSKLQMEQKRKEKIRPILDVLEESDTNYQLHILHGDAGPEIVEFANNNNYDCVVVGSRGLNSLQEMVLGSVSHKVAKRVESPVLIVK